METVLCQAIEAVMELNQQKTDQGLWDQSTGVHEAIMLLSKYIVAEGRQIREAYNAGAEEGVRDGGSTYYLETFSKSKEVKQKQ